MFKAEKNEFSEYKTLGLEHFVVRYLLHLNNLQFRDLQKNKILILINTCLI